MPQCNTPLAPAWPFGYMPLAFRDRVMGAGRPGPLCAKRSLILVRPNVARAGGLSGAAPGLWPAVALELILSCHRISSELGLAGSLLAALDRQGFHTPTPIQSGAIPALLAGRDLLGVAQTGTGKTAAFGLPLLQHLADHAAPAAAADHDAR